MCHGAPLCPPCDGRSAYPLCGLPSQDPLPQTNNDKNIRQIQLRATLWNTWSLLLKTVKPFKARKVRAKRSLRGHGSWLQWGLLDGFLGHMGTLLSFQLLCKPDSKIVYMKCAGHQTQDSCMLRMWHTLTYYWVTPKTPKQFIYKAHFAAGAGVKWIKLHCSLLNPRQKKRPLTPILNQIKAILYCIHRRPDQQLPHPNAGPEDSIWSKSREVFITPKSYKGGYLGSLQLTGFWQAWI